jgi:hypothetical protein
MAAGDTILNVGGSIRDVRDDNPRSKRVPVVCMKSLLVAKLLGLDRDPILHRLHIFLNLSHHLGCADTIDKTSTAANLHHIVRDDWDRSILASNPLVGVD